VARDRPAALASMAWRLLYSGHSSAAPLSEPELAMRSLAAHLALALAAALAASSAGCFLDFGGDDTCDDGRPRTPLLINPASLGLRVAPRGRPVQQ
jgi:hypothetical protein